MLLLQITRTDVTFYLTTTATVIAVFTVLWRLTGGAALKKIREDTAAELTRIKEASVTRLDLVKELSALKDFLRENFVSRKEFDSRITDRRNKPRN